MTVRSLPYIKTNKDRPNQCHLFLRKYPAPQNKRPTKIESTNFRNIPQLAAIQRNNTENRLSFPLFQICSYEWPVARGIWSREETRESLFGDPGKGETVLPSELSLIFPAPSVRILRTALRARRPARNCLTIVRPDVGNPGDHTREGLARLTNQFHVRTARRSAEFLRVPGVAPTPKGFASLLLFARGSRDSH